MSSYSPPRRLKQQVVLGLTPRLWEFQFVRLSEPWKPAERNSQQGQLLEPRLLTVPSCTFQSGKQEREPEGSSLGLNSWRQRELESAATPRAEQRGVRTRGRPAAGRALLRPALRTGSAQRLVSPLFPVPSSFLPMPSPAEAICLTVARLSLVYSLLLNSPNQIFTPKHWQLPVNLRWNFILLAEPPLAKGQCNIPVVLGAQIPLLKVKKINLPCWDRFGDFRQTSFPVQKVTFISDIQRWPQKRHLLHLRTSVRIRRVAGPLRAVQRHQAEPCLRNKEIAVESRADQYHPTPVLPP